MKNVISRILKTVAILTLSIIGIFALMMFIGVQNEKKGALVEKTEKAESLEWITPDNWDTINVYTKNKWIQDILDQPNDFAYGLMGTWLNQVKANFNYPETVKFKFGERPSFVNASIIDPRNGLTFIEGSGTAKNAFGAEIPFTYTIELNITPKGYDVIGININ